MPHVPPQPSSPHCRPEHWRAHAPNATVTVRSASSVSVHEGPVARSQPVQLATTEPGAGVAVSTAGVPIASDAEQVVPQSIPGPVTVPPPPTLVTASRYVAATQLPVPSHVFAAAHPGRHRPPHPSLPHERPAQAGVHAEGDWPSVPHAASAASAERTRTRKVRQAMAATGPPLGESPWRQRTTPRARPLEG